MSGECANSGSRILGVCIMDLPPLSCSLFVSVGRRLLCPHLRTGHSTSLWDGSCRLHSSTCSGGSTLSLEFSAPPCSYMSSSYSLRHHLRLWKRSMPSSPIRMECPTSGPRPERPRTNFGKRFEQAVVDEEKPSTAAAEIHQETQEVKIA